MLSHAGRLTDNHCGRFDAVGPDSAAGSAAGASHISRIGAHGTNTDRICITICTISRPAQCNPGPAGHMPVGVSWGQEAGSQPASQCSPITSQGANCFFVKFVAHHRTTQNTCRVGRVFVLTVLPNTRSAQVLSSKAGFCLVLFNIIHPIIPKRNKTVQE